MSDCRIRVDFFVVFWGRTFTRHFSELCLASLLGSTFIKEFADRYDCHLLICATGEDWKLLQDQKAFITAQKYFSVEHVLHDVSDADEGPLQVMSRGHKMLTNVVFDHRAIGIYLSPDAVFPSEFLSVCHKHIQDGFELVVAPVFRSSYETALPLIRERSSASAGLISIKSRDLCQASFFKPHSETESLCVEHDFFADFPAMGLWKTPSGNIIGHTLSWWPVVMDYRGIAHHHVDVLDRITIDGDYVYANFGVNAQMHVVTDSEELFITGLCPAEEKLPQTSRPWTDRFRTTRRWSRCLTMAAVYSDPVIDPLKRLLFEKAVIFRTSGKVQSRQEIEETKFLAKEYVKFIVTYGGRRWMKPIIQFNKYYREGVLKHGRYWLKARITGTCGILRLK